MTAAASHPSAAASSSASAARPRRIAVAAALLALAAGHFLLADRRMREDGFYARPPFGDAAAYRVVALDLRRAWIRGGPAEFLAAAAAVRSHHGPGVAAAAALASFADDVTPQDVVRVQTAFLLLFAAGAYRLARRFAGRGGALLGVVVATTAPVVALSLRPLYPQFPMAACLVWATDALLRSRGFTRLKWAVLYGAWVAAALWFKNLVPLYVAGGAAAALAAGLRRPATRRAALRGVGAAVAVAVVLAGPYYFRNLDLVLGRVGDVAGAQGQADWSGGVARHAPTRLFYYPRAMFFDGFGPALALLVLAAGATLVATRRRSARALGGGAADGAASGGAADAPGPRDATVLAAELVVSTAVLTYGQTAGGSFYLTGATALGGVAAAGAWARLGPRGRAIFGASAALAVGWTLAWTHRSFADAAPRVVVGGVALDASPDVMHAGLLRDYALRAAPDAEPWPGRDFASYVARPSRGRPPVLLFGGSPPIGPHPLCCHVVLAYETARLGAPAYCGSLGEIAAPDVLRARLLDADYVFVEERWMTAEAAASFAEAFGVRLEPVRRARATAADSFALFVARPSYAPPRRAGADALAAPEVAPVDVAYDGGPRLVGVRRARLGSETMLALYFAPTPGATRVDVEVRAEGGGRVDFDGVDFDPVAGFSDAPYRVAFVDGFVGPERPLLVRLRAPDGRVLRPGDVGRGAEDLRVAGDALRIPAPTR